MNASLSPERWRQIQDLFHEALDRDAAERDAFLDRACHDDLALRREVDSLLTAYDGADDRLQDLDRLAPASVAPPFSIPPGTRISHFRIQAPLGQGGMGVVYRAEDTRLGRTVALKFLPPLLRYDPRARARFVQEAKTASALDHPNICTIYEIGESDDGRTFIAMACYEGQTLKDRLRSGPLSVREALGIAVQMARGLAKAHAAGIVHRDVKPGNVMLAADPGSSPEQALVKLLDFGLAKMEDVTITQTGTTLGTAAYMSPEQARGEPVDARTDVWSLGVVLYEMLTGRRPFDGDYREAVLYAILNEEPPPLAEAAPEAPEALEHVGALCLEKDRALRYPSMDDVRADLEVVWQGDGESGSGSVRRAPVRRRRGPRKVVRAAGAGAAVLLVLVLVLLALPPIRQALRLGGPEAPLHLAVLPFDTVGADSTARVLSEGLMLTLTGLMTQLEPYADRPLRIVPASEVRGIATVAEARQRFGVQQAVTGTVLRDGGQVRLDLRLVDAERLDQLRSASLTEPLERFASMQTGLVTSLAELLGIALTPQARRSLTAGGTADARAYAFYLQGRAHLERIDKPENIDTAIELFRYALDEDSLYALAHAGLGRAYIYQYEHTGDTLLIARAEASSRRALTYDDRLAEARMTLGLLHVKTGAYEQALREYDVALALDSSLADLYLNKAYAYEQLQRPDEAEATYQQGLQRFPSYHRLYNKLGNFYLRSQSYQDAAEQFRRVIALTPDNTWGYNNLGAVYLYQKRWGEARPWFDRSIALRPNRTAYANLGVIAFYEGRYGEEARMYEQALRLDSSDYVIWGNLARAYKRLPDEQSTALQTFQQAIQRAEAVYRINPNSTRLKRNLAAYHTSVAGLHRAAQRYPDAAGAYEQSLRYDDADPEMWADLARTYEHLNEREKALQAIRNALRNGYPLDEVEGDPALDALRADPRFEHVRDQARPS